MKSQAVTITKLDHDGSPVLSYEGLVVCHDDDRVVARCLWSHLEVVDLGPFCLEPGDVFIEYYYLAKWFNIT